MPQNLLTAKFVQNQQAPGTYSDGNGLELRVTDKGARRWVMVTRFRGKRPEIGLGPYPDVSLLEAREKAEVIRTAKREGRDPRDALERPASKVTKSSAPTFAECAAQFIKMKAPEWSGPKQQAQWIASLEQHAFPFIGHLPVNQIELGHIETMLKRIWLKIPETASRVRSRTENILSWSIVKGYRQPPNPAVWVGNLEFLLPAKEKIAPVKHHRAMDYRDVPVFMKSLRKRDALGAKALEFAVLTTSRNSEVCGARWEEIDGDVWVIPASRMKNRHEHRVPLTPRVLEILKSLNDVDGYLFPGRRGGLSNNTLRKYLQEDMRYPDCTPHGFRSSFKDWAVEETDIAGDISEAQLAHTIKNATQAAYERGDKLRKRRELMLMWDGYCGGA